MSGNQQQKDIHLIGIGGIGISGLARIYLEKGYRVSGSDLVGSKITRGLEKLGAKIFIGKHKKENLSSSANLVVYNLAIPEDNPELAGARKKKIKCLTYPEALGELSKDYFTICVSGTHGKTTTTSMLASILLKAGLDPTVIVGSKLKELDGSNARLGKSKYLVIEADEYKRAFLNYHPKVIVVTNIEADHLDYYKDIDDLNSAFESFVENLFPKGILVANDEVFSSLSLQRASEAEPSAATKQSPFGEFIFYNQGPREKIKKVLQVPGDHNIQNALAAFAVAKNLGIPDQTIFKALSKFQGAWRRFEVKYNREVTIIDDYGHHPTEIKATLAGAQEKYPDRKLWCVFQPHQIERTRKLFQDFISSFDSADKIIIAKIFGVAGREKGDMQEEVLSKKLAIMLKDRGLDAIYLDNFEKIVNYLSKNIKKGDVIIVMGAGTINQLTPKLIKKIKPEI